MIAAQPKSTKNIDGYGFPPIEFERAIAALDAIAFGLSTAEPYGATRWRV